MEEYTMEQLVKMPFSKLLKIEELCREALVTQQERKHRKVCTILWLQSEKAKGES